LRKGQEQEQFFVNKLETKKKNLEVFSHINVNSDGNQNSKEGIPF